MNVLDDFKRTSANIAKAGDDATRWERLEQLKQIDLIRQQTKANLLQRMSNSIRVTDQKTIEVTSGEPYLFEVETSNPFDRRQKFRVVIDDADYQNNNISEPEL